MMRRFVALSSLLSLAALAACEPELPPETNLAHNKITSGGGGTGGAGGTGGGTTGKSTVGNKCSSDAECTGYDKPSCLTDIHPLKGKITDPTHMQAAHFENDLAMPFPNGYCTTLIANSCANDAACGDGAGCFRGLDGVDKMALKDLDESKGSDGKAFLPFNTVAFSDTGICLKPCKTDADCRKSEGYVCAVPMAPLIGAINAMYTKTFCVGPFSFTL